MFNKNKLMSVLALKGVTTIQLAKAVGISLATLHRKMNGESDFYRHEIQRICVFLEIENPMDIFFTQEVT